MSEVTEDVKDEDKRAQHGRVSKREFISRVARRAEVRPSTSAKVYNALVEELMEIVTSGDRLTLTGLGRFELQVHKGHRTHFVPKGEQDAEPRERHVPDYTVLKFSATRSVAAGLPKPHEIGRRAPSS